MLVVRTVAAGHKRLHKISTVIASIIIIKWRRKRRRWGKKSKTLKNKKCNKIKEVSYIHEKRYLTRSFFSSYLRNFFKNYFFSPFYKFINAGPILFCKKFLISVHSSIHFVYLSILLHFHFIHWFFLRVRTYVRAHII